MVRSIRVGALVALLACSAQGWGQMQPESFVTVREEGKPAVRCRVVKCWKEKDGSRVCQVQAVTSGEMMTVVDGSLSGAASSASRVYGWGQSKTSPKGVPTASTDAQVVSSWSSEPAKPTSPVAAEPRARTGLFNKVFGSTSSPPRTVVHATTEKPAQPDMRQSWGKVEHATPAETKVVQTSGRPELPLAKKESGDPLERPDIYTSAPATMAPVKTESGVTPSTLPLPVGPTETTPAPVPTSVTPETPSVTPEAAASSTAVTSTSGDCNACMPGQVTSKRTFANRDFGSGRSGLLSGRSEGQPVVVKESRYSSLRNPPARTEVVKTEVVPPTAPIQTHTASQVPAASQEPHVGVFAGIFNPSPPPPAKEAPMPPSNMPAGMTSVASANRAAALSNQGTTAVGAIVRMPDGQHRVVDLRQGGAMMPSVATTGSNAFASTGQSPHTYYPEHPTLANAFTLPTPRRPLPIDESMRNYVPNGLNAEGMGGAEGRPSLAMAQALAMGYYPTPMLLNPAMMSTVNPVAIRAAMHPGNAEHLSALRLSLMPSERERAVAALTQCNWKADPQVIPALVMAAQTDPAIAVRLSCVRALGTMKANTLPAVQAVSALLKDQDTRVRQEAERVLPVLTKP